jgi:hypothetical protein
MEVIGQLQVPSFFTHGEIVPGTSWIGGLVAAEPVWTPWSLESFSALAENLTRAVQPVVRHCTDWIISKKKN